MLFIKNKSEDTPRIKTMGRDKTSSFIHFLPFVFREESSPSLSKPGDPSLCERFVQAWLCPVAHAAQMGKQKEERKNRKKIQVLNLFLLRFISLFKNRFSRTDRDEGVKFVRWLWVCVPLFILLLNNFSFPLFVPVTSFLFLLFFLFAP